MTAPLDHGQKPHRPRISMAPPPVVQMQEDELDLLAVFRLIRRRIGLIAGATLLLAALQVPLIQSMDRTYSSQSRLLIHRPLSANLAGPGLESYGPLDPTTEVERLMSHTIAERIISDFALADREEFNPPPQDDGILSQLVATLRGALQTETAQPRAPTDPQTAIIAHFFDSLSVRRSGQSNVIEVGFTSRDAELAAAIPNALIQAYLDERDSQLKAQLADAREWLSGRIAAQRDRVTTMAASAMDFRAANGPNSGDFQADSADRISSLKDRQTIIQRERADLEATIDAIMTARTPADRASWIDSDRIAQLERDLQMQERELAKLLQTYGDKFGFVVGKREEVAETEAALTAEVNRHVQTLRTRIAALERDDAALAAEIAQAREALSRMGIAETTYAAMMAEVDKERTALVALEEQSRTLQTESSLPVAEVEILSPATVSRWPDGRSRTFYMLAGTVAAFFAAVTLAIILEMLDRSIRSQQQLSGLAGTTPGGLLPILRGSTRQRLPEWIMNQPDGAFADAVRGVAMAMERDGMAIMPRSILVTSALPGEGKSVVAMALAMQLAGTEGGVLLVDADFRLGRVHSSFQAPDGPGLADFLSGQVELAKVVRHDRKTGIHFIPKGRRNLLSYPSMLRIVEILDYARERHLTVIFDSAPVLATSETTRLASMLDRTLMVVRWGKTRRRTVELAVDKLRSSCADEIVIAINRVNPRLQVLYGFKDSGLFAADLRRYHAG